MIYKNCNNTASKIRSIEDCISVGFICEKKNCPDIFILCLNRHPTAAIRTLPILHEINSTAKKYILDEAHKETERDAINMPWLDRKQLYVFG